MTGSFNDTAYAQSPRTDAASEAERARSARFTGGAGVMALSPAPPATRGEPVVVMAAMRLRAPAELVFAFHADVRNLPRLTPGPARIVSASVPTRQGDVQVIEFGRAPLSVRWQARIERYQPPVLVVDVQERGPFRFWRHTHLVRANGRGSVLIDRVEFRLVPGRLGRLIDALLVAPALRTLFALRHARTRRIFAAGAFP